MPLGEAWDVGHCASGSVYPARPALPRLVDADPAEHAGVRTPGVIRLHFSAALSPAESGAELANDKGVAIPVSRAVGANAISLLPPRLRPGGYAVRWHVKAREPGARTATGVLHFTVTP